MLRERQPPPLHRCTPCPGPHRAPTQLLPGFGAAWGSPGALKGGWEAGEPQPVCGNTNTSPGCRELHRLSISPAALTPWQPEGTHNPRGFSSLKTRDFGTLLCFSQHRPLMNVAVMRRTRGSSCISIPSPRFQHSTAGSSGEGQLLSSGWRLCSIQAPRDAPAYLSSLFSGTKIFFQLFLLAKIQNPTLFN